MPMATKVLPSQESFWTEVAPQVEKAIRARAEEIWRLCGLNKMYGPRDERFTGDKEGEELLSELTKFCRRGNGLGIGDAGARGRGPRAGSAWAGRSTT